MEDDTTLTYKPQVLEPTFTDGLVSGPELVISTLRDLLPGVKKALENPEFKGNLIMPMTLLPMQDTGGPGPYVIEMVLVVNVSMLTPEQALKVLADLDGMELDGNANAPTSDARN